MPPTPGKPANSLCRHLISGCQRMLIVGFLLATLAQAQTFTTLYKFRGGRDGKDTFAGVIQDASGKLYGTTTGGGNRNCNMGEKGNGCGVVYRVNTDGTETVLHTFSGADGAVPWTPMVRDQAGNLFGTTWLGGDLGGGAVFKIDTAGKQTVLHSFTDGSDGCFPVQGLVLDESGTAFGTTTACGSWTLGTIFKVDSAGHFTLLHTFTGYPSDGATPEDGHLTMDRSGNLYGVTLAGGSGGCNNGSGAYGCGVLYKLSKNKTFSVLYSFRGGAKDGCYPIGSVVEDGAGNLYGTTGGCGSDKNDGTVWKVSKEGKETILHRFAGGTSDGCGPSGGVTRDTHGDLYGVTDSCGANNYGALYKLGVGGRFTLLHSFEGSDGAEPLGEVVRGTNGTLFGTTTVGGTGNCPNLLYDGCGTVWSYVP